MSQLTNWKIQDKIINANMPVLYFCFFPVFPARYHRNPSMPCLGGNHKKRRFVPSIQNT